MDVDGDAGADVDAGSNVGVDDDSSVDGSRRCFLLNGVMCV